MQPYNTNPCTNSSKSMATGIIEVLRLSVLASGLALPLLVGFAKADQHRQPSGPPSVKAQFDSAQPSHTLSNR